MSAQKSKTGRVERRGPAVDPRRGHGVDAIWPGPIRCLISTQVVVFPNGTPADESRRRESFFGNRRTWNNGTGACLATERTAEARGVDDVTFIESLIDEVASRTPVDPRQIFVCGHSNGAAMAYRFAGERPGRVAAVGVMAGHLRKGLGTLASPVSLLAISGAEDPFAPLDGGTVSARRRTFETRPQEANAQDWARANNQLVVSLDTQLYDAPVAVQRWGPNALGTEVRWVTVHAHGHAWPGGSRTRLPGRVIGPVSTAFDATSELWAFFRSHPKSSWVHA